jgi:hypothetical protein
VFLADPVSKAGHLPVPLVGEAGAGLLAADESCEVTVRLAVPGNDQFGDDGHRGLL